MRVFVDTSAFLSILDADDSSHHKAKARWIEFVSGGTEFFTSNYVLVETFAIVQHRLGMEAVRTFNDDILPLINLEWVDEALHKAAVGALLAASRKKLSLVDCVSFEVMRRLEIKTGFAFDAHFAEQGFKCVP